MRESWSVNFIALLLLNRCNALKVKKNAIKSENYNKSYHGKYVVFSFFFRTGLILTRLSSWNSRLQWRQRCWQYGHKVRSRWAPEPWRRIRFTVRNIDDIGNVCGRCWPSFVINVRVIIRPLWLTSQSVHCSHVVKGRIAVPSFERMRNLWAMASSINYGCIFIRPASSPLLRICLTWWIILMNKWIQPCYQYWTETVWWSISYHHLLCPGIHASGMQLCIGVPNVIIIWKDSIAGKLKLKLWKSKSNC